MTWSRYMSHLSAHSQIEKVLSLKNFNILPNPIVSPSETYIGFYLTTYFLRNTGEFGSRPEDMQTKSTKLTQKMWRGLRCSPEEL